MLSYQNSPNSIDEDEETTLPFGTSILSQPTTMTTGHDLSKRMIVIVAAGMMLVVAGGTVWMQDGGLSYNPSSAEGLVVPTNPFYGRYPCIYAVGTFGGVSTIMPDCPNGESSPFETCFQFESTSSYCWTESLHYVPNNEDGTIYYQCYPLLSGWNFIDAKDIKPVTHPITCGKPCDYVRENVVWVP